MSGVDPLRDGPAVDALLTDRLGLEDPILDGILASSRAAGLPDIAVSPLHGALLTLLAQAIGARRVLEIGTLGGYSTCCLARAVEEGGEVVTLELDPRHARVARENLDGAGVGDRVRIVVGNASASLATLQAQDCPPFDFVFIDADKGGYPLYLEASVGLCRPGALIVADNVVRGGRVLDGEGTDADVVGVRAFLAAVGRDPRLQGAATQTLGVKGWDGFALVRVR